MTTPNADGTVEDLVTAAGSERLSPSKAKNENIRVSPAVVFPRLWRPGEPHRGVAPVEKLNVLDRKLSQARKGRIWPYVGDRAHVAAVYDYTGAGRAGRVSETVSRTFAGRCLWPHK